MSRISTGKIEIRETRNFFFGLELWIVLRYGKVQINVINNCKPTASSEKAHRQPCFQVLDLCWIRSLVQRSIVMELVRGLLSMFCFICLLWVSCIISHTIRPKRLILILTHSLRCLLPHFVLPELQYIHEAQGQCYPNARDVNAFTPVPK